MVASWLLPMLLKQLMTARNSNASPCAKVVMSLREMIRLMGEVDAVIESAGGWAIK